MFLSFLFDLAILAISTLSDEITWNPHAFYYLESLANTSSKISSNNTIWHGQYFTQNKHY
jgi:hypothetical protein